MEEEKIVKKSKFKQIILPLLIVVIVGIVTVLVINRIYLNELKYDIVVSDWTIKNPEIEGGFATIKFAVLVNCQKQEKYTIHYQDVWDIHEERGHKDSVLIEIEKLSNDEISELKKEHNLQEISKIKNFIDEHIESNYDIDIEK